MPGIDLQDVIARIQDLPSLPAVVTELLSSMEQEDIDTHLLADKITLDQALTAKTLRLANSSFYGMQSQVTSIQQAITVLGFHSIRTLVTACSITGSFQPAPGSRFDFEAFWRHAVGTAVAARALAPHLRQNPETAFTAGLLHDLGTLVLVTSYPALYRQAELYRGSHDCGEAEAERAIFGLDHALVGSTLAAHWKFPLAIQAAVAGHHDLSGPDACSPSLALTVHLANILAHALDLSGIEDDLVPPLSRQAWTSAALSDDDCLQVLRDIELGFQEMCQILVGA
ncbi:HDOD domain-containing protein [Janthinobacterium agaricidamnosum]|nr:HDOD domain-containing protein [Janthinobacterium agaricidamnosum]